MTSEGLNHNPNPAAALPGGGRGLGRGASVVRAIALGCTLASGVFSVTSVEGSDLLNPYPAEPVCDGNGDCAEPYVTGWEEFFCEPLPGFRDWLNVGEGIGSLWTLMDCETGETLDVVAYDRPDIDLFDEIVSYRKSLNATPRREDVREISVHMKSLGTRFEIRGYRIESERLKKSCSSVPPLEELGCR